MGLCLLGYLSRKTVNLVLYTSSDKMYGKAILLKNCYNRDEYPVSGFTVTSSLEEAFRDTDLVLCTYPAFLRKSFIDKIEHIINPDAILCFVPGYGGAEYSCTELIKRGVSVCGFQRVPYVARCETVADRLVANILSIKHRLFVSAIPASRTIRIVSIIESLLDIPVTPLDEYLAVTLSPSNPLLHISGLYNVFGKMGKHTVFPHELKFYDEWNDTTSELLMTYDDELHSICDSLKPHFNLNEVVPLSKYYESPSPQQMTEKLKSIEPFKVVKVPLKRVSENEYVVDLESRMFAEDFPFGVCIFKALAKLTGTDTPIIDMLLTFYKRISGKEYFRADGSFGRDINDTGIPQLNGLASVAQLASFYKHAK